MDRETDRQTYHFYAPTEQIPNLYFESDFFKLNPQIFTWFLYWELSRTGDIPRLNSFFTL